MATSRRKQWGAQESKPWNPDIIRDAPCEEASGAWRRQIVSEGRLPRPLGPGQLHDSSTLTVCLPQRSRRSWAEVAPKSTGLPASWGHCRNSAAAPNSCSAAPPPSGSMHSEMNSSWCVSRLARWGTGRTAPYGRSQPGGDNISYPKTRRASRRPGPRAGCPRGQHSDGNPGAARQLTRQRKDRDSGRRNAPAQVGNPTGRFVCLGRQPPP